MALLSNNEIESILSKIGLDEFKEVVNLKNETRGRKQADIYNHWYYELRAISKYENLSLWVDDVLTGAGRLSTGNSRVSPKLIFNLLQNLPFISTRDIKEHLNSSRLRILWGDTVDDDSYCRWLRTAVLSAMRSLDYHTDKGKKIKRENEISESDFTYNLKEDIEGYIQHCDSCSSFSVHKTTNLTCPLFNTTREINTSLLKLSSTEYVDLETGEILDKMELIK